ncbi:MAG: exo-alpha-sialidase [Planctomycetota bacterium]
MTKPIQVLTVAFVSYLVLLPNVSFAESDWKLQELRYNNPGLVVDLGVGLWAWPMPMDYDNDGDLDLLVGCPDKPTNGVYFFENPSQDPSNAMPVFRPGVRLGKASHNMQMSYVGGASRILRSNMEFVRDEETGEFNFESGTRIYPKVNVHNKSVRANMWRYVDFDGDGDHDIIAGVGDWTDYGWDHAYDSQGRWRNGPLHGYIYVISNTGTNDKPKYSQSPQRLKAAGGDIDVYGWPSPNFADFDSDGDLDLLCGEFLDGFTYFENIGSRSEPIYAAGSRLKSSDGKSLVMDLQMITPTSVDWDSDGDIDLIVGDEDGRVAFIENTGRFKDRQPVFRSPRYFQQEADTLKFGALATPFSYDWDSDGDQDILCGNTAGHIGMFENLGSDSEGNIKWSKPSLLSAKEDDSKFPPATFRVLAGPSGSIQGPAEAKWGYTTLTVADWDRDNDPDIIYNSILSRVGMLRNDEWTFVDTALDSKSLEAPPKWCWWRTLANDAITQWRTTPVAIDFDEDGSMDLVMLDQEGFLTIRRSGGAAERIFIDENNQSLRLNNRTSGRSGRVKIDVVDWDGDDRLDLLVNSENALWYRNCETRDGKVVLKRIGNLAKRNVAGHTSSPTACDLNQDGKPDLMVGAENGRIYFAAHDDCNSFADDELRASTSNPLPSPRFPGLISESFIYTKAKFPECHASTICETERGLVAAWFGGSKEGREDVVIWTSYHDGSGWSNLKMAADGIQYQGLRYPTWNPVLYKSQGDGPTLLFFKVGPNARDWWGEVLFSYDHGRTFRNRHRLPEGIDGPVRSKPMLLPDGRLLCPSSTEHDHDWRMHFEVLLDPNHPERGNSWQRFEPTEQPFQVIQPTLLDDGSNNIIALMRSKHSRIFQTMSHDQGQSWSEITDTGLPNPNSGIEALTLDDGRHLLVYNHSEGNRKDGWGSRNRLNLAISDDGFVWHEVTTVESVEKGELSYPAMIQTSDGKVHLTYTWNRKRIRHCIINPAELVRGEVINH